jgi:hypothetical protein
MAAKASEAADTLTAWLQTQPRATEHAREGTEHAREEADDGIFPGDQARAGGATPTASDPAAAGGMAAASTQSAPSAVAAPQTVANQGTSATLAPLPRSPDPGRADRHAPLRLAHTDWLYHRLQVSGPAADLAGFRAAAAGAGTVPWQLDLDRMAEDFFHLLVAPPVRAGSLVAPARSLSLAGARILADQLCAAVARRQALAAAQVGRSRACPFDLHALVPVPDAVLRRGPDDPIALDWLWAHWGTTQTLRHVADETTEAAVLRPRASQHASEGTKHAREGSEPAREGPAGEAVWAVSFWSADWTPWRALAQIAARWPTLRFDARPRYDTP